MSTVIDAQPPMPADELPGDHLVKELLWVHGLIRHDLQAVRELAQRVQAGAPPLDVRAEIGSLQTSSPPWKLRVNCLYYCRFVHTHHGAEDWALFPALRRSSPALESVVDKLEADHRRVSDHLDDVETAADDLVQHDSPAGRSHVVEALSTVAEFLLTHLDYEEQSISPTLRQWTHWPAH